MKTIFIRILSVIVGVFLLISNTVAQEKYKSFSGKIVDKTTHKALAFSTVSLTNSNISTIANLEGEFLIKIPLNLSDKEITISHLGYKNLTIPLNKFGSTNMLLEVETAYIPLESITVMPLKPKELILSLLKNIKTNYSQKPNIMTGFYRETIKQGKRYVSLSEAVVEIYKPQYTSSFRRDWVNIYRGRKSTDIKKADTLLLKLQGGPYSTLLLDIIENPYILLSKVYMEYYNYELSDITTIDNRHNYVIDFKQKEGVDDPLYMGRFFIDQDKLALTGAEFSLNIKNKEEASKMFIKKKPIGVKFTVESAKYIVQYKQKDSIWYFNYARGETKFKCKWDRKLFNTHFTTMIEMAITDRTEDITNFNFKKKVKRNVVMTEKVSNFEDPDFWGEYNTIEPDQSIVSAIKKLKRKLKRRKKK